MESSSGSLYNTDTDKPKPPTDGLSASAAPRPSAARGPRTPRVPRRMDAQPTKLESVDGGFDPLGPLGDASNDKVEPPPPTPSKEQSFPIRSARQAGLDQRIPGGPSIPADGPDDLQTQGSRARHPPPVEPLPAGVENIRRQGQPSMSIEQAAKPSFDITVGDPHKVGDLTSSHIVYQVHTKVRVLCPENDQSSDQCRLRRKATDNQNSQLHDDTETFTGSTLLYITTILELLYLHLQRSRPWAVSTAIS